MTAQGDTVPLVDGYEIICRIAAGDMADVWLAHPLSGNHPPVVLKTILPYLASDRDFARSFEREARLAASLDHHNIVPVLDYGQSHGTWYIAMEFVSGCSLRQVERLLRARGKASPPWLVLGVAATACDALHAAHGRRDADGKPRGIIHGDVTPENIMLSTDGVVKVVDFGIARAANAAYVNSRVTRGKIAYLAPEIADAWAGSTLDARSDVYSLGVILYEALTGAHPYPDGGDLEMLRLIRPDGPTSVRRAARWIPERLSKIVMRAISRDPETRFPSAAELGAAIDDFLGALGARPTEAQIAAYLTKLVGPSEPPDSRRSAHSAVLRMNALEESVARIGGPTPDLPPDSMADAPPSATWAEAASPPRTPVPCPEHPSVTVVRAVGASSDSGGDDATWDAIFEADLTGSGQSRIDGERQPDHHVEPPEPAPRTQRVWDLSTPTSRVESSARVPIQVPIAATGRRRRDLDILSRADSGAARPDASDAHVVRGRPRRSRGVKTAEGPVFARTGEQACFDESRAVVAPEQDLALSTSVQELAPIAAPAQPVATPAEPGQVGSPSESAEADTVEEELTDAARREGQSVLSTEGQESRPPDDDRPRSVWETTQRNVRIGRSSDRLWERSALRRSAGTEAEGISGAQWDEITARAREQAEASGGRESAPEGGEVMERAAGGPAPSVEPAPESDAVPGHSWDRVTRKMKKEKLAVGVDGTSAGVAPARGGRGGRRSGCASTARSMGSEND